MGQHHAGPDCSATGRIFFRTVAEAVLWMPTDPANRAERRVAPPASCPCPGGRGRTRSCCRSRPFSWAPRETLRVQVVLRPVLGEGVVVRRVQLPPGEFLAGSVGEGDGDGRAGGEMPLHADEAFGVLLELDQWFRLRHREGSSLPYFPVRHDTT